MGVGAVGCEALDPGEKDGGCNEGDVNDDLPHDHPVIGDFFDVDEGFEEVNGRDANKGRGEFDLENAGIHVGEPFGLVGMSLEAEARDEGFVAADDDHDEEVGDHDNIDEAQDAEHHFGFGESRRLLEQVPQLNHEAVNVHTLSNDEAEIERGLQPAAEKDEAAESLLLPGAMGRVFHKRGLLINRSGLSVQNG